MKYLDIVNNVLRRLREDEVGYVDETTYSKMVGDYVNDAKEFVEVAWDWSALRKTIDFYTEEDVTVYPLQSGNTKYKEMDGWNVTSKFRLGYKTQRWFNDRYKTQSVPKGAPYKFTFDGMDEDGDPEITVFPIPDKGYNLQFQAIVRSPPLVDGQDKLLVPSAPVIHTALALLARERGETGGTSTAEYGVLADKYLADAIALDAARHPEETIWYTP